MNAYRFPESNTVMRAPANMPDCADIHAFIGDTEKREPIVITAWKPTPEELVKINLGEPVYLFIWGQAMPPVALTMENPFTPVACGESDE